MTKEQWQMYDLFSRSINYLRISVTDRCNLRCTYCMPEVGVKSLPHQKILSFEEIVDVVSYGVGQGINKVRITGGEPLVRRDITRLVEMLSDVRGIKDLAMTTNGLLLGRYATSLAAAGLHRVNISLDTADPERFRSITRGGDIHEVFRGIEAADKAGLHPVKINCVIRETPDEPDALGVAAWGAARGYDVRFIHVMDLHAGSFSQVIGGDGGNCALCNRLRLTADGHLRPCLFSDTGFGVRELGVAEAFRLATEAKPACGSTNTTGAFYNIGG